jgi:hypothetical protein
VATSHGTSPAVPSQEIPVIVHLTESEFRVYLRIHQQDRPAHVLARKLGVPTRHIHDIYAGADPAPIVLDRLDMKSMGPGCGFTTVLY